MAFRKPRGSASCSYQRGRVGVLEDVVDEDGEVRVVAEQVRERVERVRRLEERRGEGGVFK